jgi:hypothetical protein
MAASVAGLRLSQSRTGNGSRPAVTRMFSLRFEVPHMPTIPGTRLVEDVLKALPTQARLESENRELRAKVEELTAKVAVLQAQLKAAQPPEGIEPDALKVLKVLFEHNHSLVAQTFEDILGMKPGVSTYHCDNLCKLGLAKNTASYACTRFDRRVVPFLSREALCEKA